MLGYIISFFVFVKLYTPIEFQLQQHNRGRGDFRRTNTRWSVLGIQNRQALSDCTNTSIDYLLFCFSVYSALTIPLPRRIAPIDIDVYSKQSEQSPEHVSLSIIHGIVV